MFGFLSKNKEINLYAPVTGKVMKLNSVSDEVFASGMMGEGLAFELTDGKVCAPCDGEITMIFPTMHAFGMKVKKGAEILIHIGLDTVELNGVGFKQNAKVGDFVKMGEPIITVDLDMIKGKGYDLSTPMILTNHKEFNITEYQNDSVIAGKTMVMKIEKK